MLEQQTTLKGGQVMIYYYVAKLLYGLDRPRWTSGCWNCGATTGPPWAFAVGMHVGKFGRRLPGALLRYVPRLFSDAYVLGVRLDGPVSNQRLVIEPRLADLTVRRRRDSDRVRSGAGFVEAAEK